MTKVNLNLSLTIHNYLRIKFQSFQSLDNQKTSLPIHLLSLFFAQNQLILDLHYIF